jgi:hypothetical protein
MHASQSGPSWHETKQPVFAASAAAQVNASNNAGDTPWHWATNMGWGEVAGLLERNGASKQKGGVLVPEHVPKVKVRLSQPWQGPLKITSWTLAGCASCYCLAQGHLVLGLATSGSEPSGQLALTGRVLVLEHVPAVNTS